MSSILKNLHLPFAVAAIGLATSTISRSTPISINATGSHTQDFNSLINTGTGTWTDDSTIAGWYAQRSGTGTSIAADTGSGTGGNLYSYGSTSATDRALGSIGSSNAAAGNFAWGVQFRNTGASAATIGTVAFTGEQWRKGGGTTTNVVTLWYKISSTQVTSLNPGTSNTGWTALTSGDFTSPVNTTGGAALDGNATANKVAISFNSNLTLNAGEYLMFRWSDPDHTGTDHGLAIDDVSVSWATSDTTPPVLAAVSPLSPADNSTGIAINTPLSLTFSEPIAAGSGDISLHLASNGSVVEDFTVGTAEVVISGSTATFTPSTPLLNDTDYYVTMPSGVIVDLAPSPGPNAFAGISAPAVSPVVIEGWNFKTIPASDVIDPAIVTLSPADNASNVELGSTLGIVFSENVIAVAGGTIDLFDSNDSLVESLSVTGSSVNVTGTTVTATLTAPTVRSTSYYVRISDGAFKDAANNTFDGIVSPDKTSWNFATDSTNPTATSFTPDGVTGISPPTTLSITFSEPVQVASGGSPKVRVKRVSDGVAVAEIETSLFGNGNVSTAGNVATIPIPPSSALTYSMDYYVVVDAGAFEDLSKNPFGGVAEVIGENPTTYGSDWTFSTGAEPPPAPLVISQYYEGTGFNKFIELHNTSGGSLNLSAYKLALWSNALREGWKTANATSTPPASLTFPNVTLLAGEYYLIKNGSATTPAYATSGANLTDNSVINFNGDDSVVLYSGSTFETANIVDAVSISASNGTGSAPDTSVYRLTNSIGHNLTAGSSYAAFPSVWATDTNAAVNAATAGDNIYLQGLVVPVAPTLATFVVAGNIASTPVQSVQLDYTITGTGVPTEYMASEDAAFTGASWLTLTNPITFTLSSGAGSKTVYFKLKNAVGESSAINDSITLGTYTYVGNVVISQYYEGTANNKYIELSNRTASPIDLSTWNIVRWTNENAEAWKITGSATGLTNSVIPLTGVTVPAHGTVVIAHASATSPILAANTSLTSTNLSFTGNDSVALYNGTPTPANLVDVASFTFAGNEGIDTSFVRLIDDQGFSFTTGSEITDFPTVWSNVILATVNAATAGINEHLGTYPGGNTYETWKADNANGDAADVDTDGDGIDNGAEYFMGTLGNVFNQNPSPVAGVVTWPRATGPTITSFKVEVSTNLSTWENATVNYSSNLVITGSSVTFTLPTTPGPFFVRLNVTP